MADVIGTLRAVLEAQTAQFDAAMKQSATVVEGFDTRLQSVVSGVKTMAGALGIGLGIGTIVSFGRSILDTASNTKDLADKLGISTQAAQQFKFAADQTGTNIGTLGTSITRMNNALTEGNTGTVAALTAAGLRLSDLRKMRPEDAFLAIAEAIRQIPDPMRQTQVALELFGRSGAELLPGIKEGFADIAARAEFMSDETVRALEEAQDQLEELGNIATITGGKIVGAILRIGRATSSPQALTDYAAGWATIATQQDLVTNAMVDRMAPALRGQSDLLKRLEPPIINVTQATKDQDAAMKPLIEKMKQAEAAAKAYEEKIQGLADKFSGRSLQRQIDDAAAAVTRLGGAMQMNASEATALAEQTRKWEAAGGKIPPVLREVQAAALAVWSSTLKLSDSVKVTTFDLDKLGLAAVSASPFMDKLKRDTDELNASWVAMGKTLDAAPLFTLDFAGPISDSVIVPLETAEERAKRLGEAAAEAARKTADAWGAVSGMISQVFGGIAASSTGAMRIVSGVMQQVGGAIGPEGFSGKDLATGVSTFGVGLWVDAFHQRQRNMARIAELEALLLGEGESPVGREKKPTHHLDNLEAQYVDLTAKINAATDAQLRLTEAIEQESDAVDRVRQLTDQYGISYEALGNSVIEADLAQKAMDLAEAWDFLVNDRFADSTTVLEGMKDEAQAFIDRALAFGVKLPDSMQPLLQKMIEMGLLTDENGVKLEDLSRIEFSKTLEDEIGDVAEALKDLPEKFVEAFMKAFGAIGGQATLLADDLHKKLGNLKIKGSFEGFAIPQLAEGGFIQRDTIAQLHAGEVVIPKDGMPGGGAALLGEVQGMRDDLARLPGEITRGWRAAMQLM